VDVFTNFWSVVYIFSSKKTTYHFGGAHDDRLLLAIHASCQYGVRTLPPISKRFCIVRVILHTSLILYTSLSHVIFPHVDCLLVCCARGRGLFNETFFLDGRSELGKSQSQSALYLMHVAQVRVCGRAH